MRKAAAIGAVLAVGLLIGRATAPSPQTADGGAGSPGPSREVAGVPVGYSHTREGAILATARYQQAFANVSILRPGVLRKRIQAVATPDFALTMLEANSPGTERLASGALGAGVRAHVQTLYVGVPVGYRVLRYSPARARILTWGFTLLGNAAALEPAAYFGTARTDLAWSDGDWKIASTSASFGPTPRLATPRRGGEGFELIDLARSLNSYGAAP
jgi:hypothetical protein